MQNVTKKFVQGDNVVSVFVQTSFDFLQGNSYAIMGSSGSGKSTCIHLLAGIDVPTQGEILFNHKNLQSILKSKSASFFQQEIGIVFQQPCLFAELTVIENVMLFCPREWW